MNKNLVRSVWGRVLVLAVVSAVFLANNTGCQISQRLLRTGGWAADYDVAERQVRETGQDLLVFYRDDHIGRKNAMTAALKEKAIKSLSADYVCCTLARSYEPDRRYVAQFGVERAPALIRIHRDGTYHATTQVNSTADILQFIDQAAPPGAKPMVNPHIPRLATYHWRSSIEEAQAAARRSDRPLLVVYARWLSSDWLRIKKFLMQHEVYARLAPLVHARVRPLSIMRGSYHTPFGTLQLPALVIAFPDGTFSALELPTSADAIVRFADTTLASEENPESSNLAGSTTGGAP